MKRLVVILVVFFSAFAWGQIKITPTEGLELNGKTTTQLNALNSLPLPILTHDKTLNKIVWFDVVNSQWVVLGGVGSGFQNPAVESLDMGNNSITSSGTASFTFFSGSIADQFTVGLMQIGDGSTTGDKSIFFADGVGNNSKLFVDVSDSNKLKYFNDQLNTTLDIGASGGGSAAYRNPPLIFTDRAAGVITNDWTETVGLEGSQLWNENILAEDRIYTYNGSFTSAKKALVKPKIPGASMTFVPSSGFSIQANTETGFVDTSISGDGITITHPYSGAFYERGTVLYFEGVTTLYTEQAPNFLTQSNAATDDTNSTNGFSESFAPNANISMTSKASTLSGDSFMIEFVLDVGGQSGWFEIPITGMTIGDDYKFDWEDQGDGANQSIRNWEGFTTAPNIAITDTNINPRTQTLEAAATSGKLKWFVSEDATGTAGQTLKLFTLIVTEIPAN